MGETLEWLETHGAPGMVMCSRTGNFIAKRCEECARCIRENGGCEDCEAECPEWTPDGPEPD